MNEAPGSDSSDTTRQNAASLRRDGRLPASRHCDARRRTPTAATATMAATTPWRTREKARRDDSELMPCQTSHGANAAREFYSAITLRCNVVTFEVAARPRRVAEARWCRR